jgi:hypothetical protein
MKVVYLGRASRRANGPPTSDGDVIELLSNNWDDFSYKTSFPVVCRVNGEILQLELVRLLIAGVHTSSAHLDRLLKLGWDGEFPIPDTDYISTPSDITFYEQLEGELGTSGAIEVAKLLRDASYLVRIGDDEAAKALVDTEGFKKSLQRERGPNGSGKSRVLHQMVQDWIAPSKTEQTGFVSKPNLSQVVVVSYSPFERFPVDLAGKNLQDVQAYRYFGFRGRSAASETSKLGRIKLSHEFPRRNAAQALLSCLTDDKRYRFIRDWARKVPTVERVLKTAIDFDYATVEMSGQRRVKGFYSDTTFIDPISLEVEEQNITRHFIPIASDRIDKLNDEELAKHLQSDSEVTFFRDEQPIKLSSGQRLFAYIVINILGAIRRNSLILVDEPELFLHPTLEIQFVDMLKTILASFSSKALLATHSVVTVREVPADCVHVFEKTEDELILKHPPFQTFGGDFQRISSYVFGDKAVSKPFEAWIRAQLEELGSANDLIEALGDELNEELIVQIRATERGQW